MTHPSFIDIDRLREEFPERTIDYHPVIDSTMVAAAALELGSIVIADQQTAGQGRHGHQWHSEAGTGVYCSIVLKPAPLLTLALGLATAEAITSVAGVPCDLRWPNDVMIAGKKAAGILVQLVDGKAIGGIGINVNHTTFPTELRGLATSLFLEAGRPLPHTAILRELLHAVDAFANQEADAILRLFTRASSYASGRRVVVEQPGGVLEGTTAGLDPSGYLIVRRDDGTSTLVLAGGVRAAGS